MEFRGRAGPTRVAKAEHKRPVVRPSLRAAVVQLTLLRVLKVKAAMAPGIVRAVEAVEADGTVVAVPALVVVEAAAVTPVELLPLLYIPRDFKPLMDLYPSPTHREHPLLLQAFPVLLHFAVVLQIHTAFLLFRVQLPTPGHFPQHRLAHQPPRASARPQAQGVEILQ